jgi:hypothetical protein
MYGSGFWILGFGSYTALLAMLRDWLATAAAWLLGRALGDNAISELHGARATWKSNVHPLFARNPLTEMKPLDMSFTRFLARRSINSEYNTVFGNFSFIG